MADLFWFSDAQQARIEPLLPTGTRGKGGLMTTVCNAKGRPFVLLLTPGNVHDCKFARHCIEAMPPSAGLIATVICYL